MNKRTRRLIPTGLVLFHAGGLIPIELPCPQDSEGAKIGPASEAGKSEGEAGHPNKEARETLGHNLRWAFPLPDSGSFNRLVEALGEA